MEVHFFFPYAPSHSLSGVDRLVREDGEVMEMTSKTGEKVIAVVGRSLINDQLHWRRSNSEHIDDRREHGPAHID
jgi:hypothetical protein